MAVKQVSVFIENETGRLAALTQLLAEHGVDLNAATIAETGEYGILRCIVQNPEETVRILSGGGFMASVTEVLAVGIDNRPGGLNRVLQILSDAGIGVKYIYSTIQSIKGEAVIMMKTGDQNRAEKLLESADVKLCTMDELK
ncbi:MAG: ACT domain-containing protein [Firmicutes bacterium]|nr:ACT domain-containing protein [Bacillota bacterium]